MNRFLVKSVSMQLWLATFSSSCGNDGLKAQLRREVRCCLGAEMTVDGGRAFPRLAKQMEACKSRVNSPSGGSPMRSKRSLQSTAAGGRTKGPMRDRHST